MSIAEAHRHAKQVISDPDALDFVQTLLDSREIVPGAVLDHNFDELQDLVRRQLSKRFHPFYYPMIFIIYGAINIFLAELRQAKNIPLCSGLIAKYDAEGE